MLELMTSSPKSLYFYHRNAANSHKNSPTVYLLTPIQPSDTIPACTGEKRLGNRIACTIHGQNKSSVLVIKEYSLAVNENNAGAGPCCSGKMLITPSVQNHLKIIGTLSP